MLYSYEEALKEYRSDYRIKLAVRETMLYKLEPGLYSDQEYVADTAIIMKKYPKSVFTLDSGFYYQGLTDTIPSYYYLATDKDAAKIKDEGVKQIFDNSNSMNLGVETMMYSGSEIRVFSKERLLIELMRSKTKLPFDYYKDIISSYRRIVDDIDFSRVEDFASKLPKTNMVMEAIQLEVL
jgi:hypothetical protein